MKTSFYFSGNFLGRLFSLIIIWTQKKKIILIDAWVLIDPYWSPHRLSHQYGNLKQSNIDTIDPSLTFESEYQPGSFANLNLFFFSSLEYSDE